MPKSEIRPLSHTIDKNNWKWIKGLNVRAETTKFLEDLGNKLFDIALSNIFLDIYP